MNWKELLVVGVSAAGAELARQKIGDQIEAKAVSWRIPPVVAHLTVVGGLTMAGYALAKAFII